MENPFDVSRGTSSQTPRLRGRVELVFRGRVAALACRRRVRPEDAGLEVPPELPAWAPAIGALARRPVLRHAAPPSDVPRGTSSAALGVDDLPYFTNGSAEPHDHLHQRTVHPPLAV